MPKRLTGKYRWRYQSVDEDESFHLLEKLPFYTRLSVPDIVGWNVQTKGGKNLGTSVTLRYAEYDEEGNRLPYPEYQPIDYEVVRNDG